jgi:UTP--glucose-1-phosphate uridylyltransferase
MGNSKRGTARAGTNFSPPRAVGGCQATRGSSAGDPPDGGRLSQGNRLRHWVDLPCPPFASSAGMDIRKAVITAAGKSQRTLPLQTLVDRDGVTKSALVLIIEEVLRAGIEQIAIVIAPGDEAAFCAAAGQHASRLTFVEQAQPLGYTHAVACAARFCGNESFLLLVGDHLYLSHTGQGCAEQLVAIARAEKSAVSAVQSTHESKLPYYGAVGGKLVDAARRIYQVDTVLEKPTPTEAEQRINVPGLRAGYYLCFFGMHVLTPSAHRLLEGMLKNATGRENTVHLREALTQLASHERYLAAELDGRRYDFGVKYGLLTAQLALALAGQDRDEVLRGIVELLATNRQPGK